MQMQADFLGVPVQRPQNIESTGLGAAYMAGLGRGYWSSKEDLTQLWRLQREFAPKLKSAGRQARLAEWQSAIDRTK
jgi:glycerol kinase